MVELEKERLKASAGRCIDLVSKSNDSRQARLRRINGRSINYDACEIQPGDDRPQPFSFMNDEIEVNQLPCWITYTNDTVHDLIRANLHRAPMYSGQISSNGPRYCPSIEDKVVRFAERSQHQLFLEPEGYDTEEVYVNGISTSLPRDVQDAMFRSIKGLGAGSDYALRLRRRIRLLPAGSTCRCRLNRNTLLDYFSRAKSTARPVMKRPVHRV